VGGGSVILRGLSNVSDDRDGHGLNAVEKYFGQNGRFRVGR
jgi:hypothetical protein